MQTAISERNTIGNSEEQGDLQGVQAEVGTEEQLGKMDDDTVQEQSREYLEEKPVKKRKKSIRYNEIETMFLIWSNGSAPVGDIKKFFRFGKMRFYEKTESGCVELSVAQYNERRDIDVSHIDRRAKRELSQVANNDGNSQGGSSDNTQRDRHTGGISEISKHSFGEQLRNDLGGSTSSGGTSSSQAVTDDIQNQQRTDTLTDREVLEMAANEIKVSDLTDAEIDALTIFQDRLSNLKDLQEERAKQGRLYKEQQFGEKVDRAKAAETLNRMHILDNQIKKATNDILSAEEKEVLKRVIQKARKVVEVQEREHGKEILNRWRDRRNNAAAMVKMMFEIKNNNNIPCAITPQDKRKQLYLKQKENLDIFLSNGAITKEQYDFSHNGLVTKMGITKDELDSWIK